MKNKKGTAWEILDNLWKEFSILELEESKNLTWKELLEKCSPVGTDDWVKNIALEKFIYETRYVFKEPNRETMNHLWGSHVELYDFYGCKEHRLSIQTSDDTYDYVEGQTIFCPICNRDKMTTEKFEKFMDNDKVKTHTEEQWKMLMKIAKFHQNWDRKQNFKYMLKHLFDFYYWKYKLAR